MKYKYSRWQLFAKKLNVPKEIMIKIYNRNLSFKEFFDYNLIDKIPISCLEFRTRFMAENLGINGLNKLRMLDLDLVDKYAIEIKVLLSKYNYVVPDNFSEKVYQEIKDKMYSNEKVKFAKALLRNELQIADSEIENLINNYEKVLNILLNYSYLLNDFDVLYFINNLYNMQNNSEKTREYIKQFTDEILNNAYEKYNNNINFSNFEYKEIFKYSSMEEYFKKISKYRIDSVMRELGSLPKDYVFTIPIPLQTLFNFRVLCFISTFGLKNVVDFDNECGHFFTANNCQMLKLMYDMYLHYGGNVQDPNKTIYTKDLHDENEGYVDRPYTKDEFYEAMKRMVLYGPTDWNYADKAPDYRNMMGEFRVRNAQLFISEQAPEELKKLFYTKNITPQLLVEHPEYIPYLDGKDLGSCFRLREIYVDGSTFLHGYENFYNFLEEKTDFNSTISFITDYCDILDIVFDHSTADRYEYEIKFSKEDNIDEIKRKINESFRIHLIKKSIAYPKNIPQSIISNYPSMFLDPDAPKELQEAFYSRTINSELILSNPVYRNYLKNVDLEIIFKYMPVSVSGEYYSRVNLVNVVQQVFGAEESFDVILGYGKYIESVFEANGLQNFNINPNFSKDDLLNEIDSNILQVIIEGKMKYDENIPRHFKNNNPTLFLSEDVPEDIRKRFYNRELTLDDFTSNPDLLDAFRYTNVVCGFSEKFSWMIPLFDCSDNPKKANFNRLKVISEYLKIKDFALQDAFKQYIMEFDKNIDIEKIEYVSEILLRLSLSNSSEIFTFRKELANQLLKSANPIESLNKIEDVFIRNNIPIVGKIYSCFEILHPDFKGFNFNSPTISPILKQSSTMAKKVVVFSDLIKAAFGSNNRSVNAYLKNIEIGSKLYESIKSGQIEYDSLDKFQKNELIIFSKHLATLYNKTLMGGNDAYTVTEDVLNDIFELSKKLSPDGTLKYNLADRIIKMFCGFTGIKTLEQAKCYINQKIKDADARNRNFSNSEIILEQGDFVKGICNISYDIAYLRNILQNGSVSKEYLGYCAESDKTPLDTDVSIITESDGTIKDKISKTAASGYGPIWFVLKNDDRFITTRNSNETFDVKNDASKMEVFYTGVLGPGHYGIRTGFASSEINYIIMNSYDPRVGLEIAMNGFYIPVVNTSGKLVFSPNDYDKLREKMAGISYYDEKNYNISNNLINEGASFYASQIEQNKIDTKHKKDLISENIKKSLSELGLTFKDKIDGDLSDSVVEVIDTGSTGRNTNIPGDSDFDFMMKLDKSILADPSKLSRLKETILKNLGKENTSEITESGDFKLKKVKINDEVIVDIDITFTNKTDKVSYSTDMCLQDRLETIHNQNPEQYKYVVANILLAKKVLKDGEVYKPNRGDIPQGGLGGIGIENWILQNGGSFIDAAKSFLDAAEGKTFEDFKSAYYIWDFGDNHLAEKRGHYPHDNFVANNMSEVGYYKMGQVLKEYLKYVQISNIETNSMKK